MTISEARHLVDIFSRAVQGKNVEMMKPISALRGRTTLQVEEAVLLVAADQVRNSKTAEDHKNFDAWLRSAAALSWQYSAFVPDEVLREIQKYPEGHSTRRMLASEAWSEYGIGQPCCKMEELATFLPYCESIKNDPKYWQLVRERLGVTDGPLPPTAQPQPQPGAGGCLNVLCAVVALFIILALL